MSFTKAIAIDPDNVDAYYNRALAYDNLGNHQEAIKDFTKVIAINPDDTNAYYNRGYAQYLLGNLNQAEADASKLCALGDCSLRDVLEKQEKEQPKIDNTSKILDLEE